jgi:hypothetical protein
VFCSPAINASFATRSRSSNCRSALSRAAATGVAALAVAHAASGALVKHYDSAAWHAAAGPVTTVSTLNMPLGPIDSASPWGIPMSNPQPWENQGLRLGGVFGGVTMGSQYGGITDDMLDVVWGVPPTTSVLKGIDEVFNVFLAQPTKSFSFEMAHFGWIGFLLFFTDGTQGGVYLNDLSDNFIFDPVFYGITSDKEFYKLEVYVGDLSVSGSAATSYTKSFSWGAPIPAPAAGALLGLAGLAARRQRAR